MIRVYVPGLLQAQIVTWIQGKTIPMTFFPTILYDPTTPLITVAGYVVEMLVDDSIWSKVRTYAASLAVLSLAPRVRVVFTALDSSAAEDRPASRLAWVYQDGHQEEA